MQLDFVMVPKKERKKEEKRNINCEQERKKYKLKEVK